ncbi:4'-phosphopantetheinyl transferase superfamily protein [Candidatus Sumerlaeota bacterium]|nr:4'-phosphopantetheinyl transferase superfamily protein [Candidatus Sumerlaeota bacterium]
MLPSNLVEDAWMRALSPDERERAAAMRHAGARENFMQTRAILRRILADALQTAPETLRFTAGPQGKPRLAGETHDALNFNVSHTDGLALIALCREARVGVDAERLREIEAAKLARRYFAVEERRVIDAAAPERRLETFFAVWTLKEALLKATGEGVTRPLNNFAVSPHEDGTASLLRDDHRAAATGAWTLVWRREASGHIIAAAVEASPARFQFHDFSWTQEA